MNEIIFGICLLVVIYFFGGFGRFLVFLICAIPVFAGTELIVFGLHDFGVVSYIMLAIGLGLCIVSAFLLSIMDDKTLLVLGLYAWLIGTPSVFFTTEDGLGQYLAVRIICSVVVAAVPVATVIIRYKRTRELPWYLQRAGIFEFWKQSGFMEDEEHKHTGNNYEQRAHSQSVSDLRRILDDALEPPRFSDDKHTYESARKERKARFIIAVKPYFKTGMLKLIYAGNELCVINVSDCFYIVCPYVLINSYAFGALANSKGIEHIIEDERRCLVDMSYFSAADYKKYILLLNPESMLRNQHFIQKVTKKGKRKYVDKELEERIAQKYGEPEIWYDEN